MKQASKSERVSGGAQAERENEREARLLGSWGLEGDREDRLSNTAMTLGRGCVLKEKVISSEEGRSRAGVSIHQGSVVRTQTGN